MADAHSHTFLAVIVGMILISTAFATNTTSTTIATEIDANGAVQAIGFARIAIICALLNEAQPMITELGLTESAEMSQLMHPMQVYSNAEQSIYIICNGVDSIHNVHRIGTQAAAINAFLTIQLLKPELIISAGISGAIVQHINNQSINIGDVFVADKVIYHDRRINVAPWSNGWHLGNYRTFDILGSVLSSEKSIRYLRKERGIIVSTGNSFPECHHDHEMWREHGATLTEMEAAAIAEVCLEKNVPFAAIKAVSNYVYAAEQGSAADEFESHMERSVNQLASATIDIIQSLLLS